MTITRLLLHVGFLLQLQQIAAQFPSCSICRASETVLNGDVVIPADTAGLLDENMTCTEVEAMANGGTYSPAVCSLLSLIVSGRCGCEAVAVPTESPVATETSAPAPTTTELPVELGTESPVLIATEAPAVADTESPVATTEAPAVALTEAPTVTPTEAPLTATGTPTIATTETPVAVAATEPPVTSTEAPAVVPTESTQTPVVVSPETEAPAAAILDTDAPAVAVPATQAPVATATATEAPATEAPAIFSAPTSAPISGELDAEVFVRLVGLSSAELPDTETFERTCTTFLGDKLQDVSELACAVVSSRSVARKLRALQSSNLEVQVNVSGKSQSLSEEEFFNSVFQALNEDSNLFLASLKGANPNFEPVELMEVSSSSFAVEPTDTTESTKKLSSGDVARILIGTVAAVIILGVVILIVCKKLNAKRPYPEVQESAQQNTAMVNPPPASTKKQETRAPVASVENAASDLSGSESQENQSFHKSGSSTVAGESEMESFSVAAGNVEETVAKSGAAGDTSASGDELSSHAMSSLRQTMISRTIVAPPGKLGIVIDTTLEGPIVFKINPQSPLEGSLFPGDIIVAIDDVDTRAMSASAITALMVRTANLRRTLTVLSEDVNN